MLQNDLCAEVRRCLEAQGSLIVQTQQETWGFRDAVLGGIGGAIAGSAGGGLAGILAGFAGGAFTGFVSENEELLTALKKLSLELTQSAKFEVK